MDRYKKAMNSHGNDRDRVEFNMMKSVNHNIGTYRCSKVGLSIYDDKRHYLEKDFSLPHGHHAIPKIKDGLMTVEEFKKSTGIKYL